MSNSKIPPEDFGGPSSQDGDAARSLPPAAPNPPTSAAPDAAPVLATSQLALLTHALDRLTARTDRLEGRQDKIIYVMEKIQDHQEKLMQSQQMLAQTQYRIAASAEKSTDVQAQLAAGLASTDAAIARLDRLMDFVFRQTLADPNTLVVDADLMNWFEHQQD